MKKQILTTLLLVITLFACKKEPEVKPFSKQATYEIFFSNNNVKSWKLQCADNFADTITFAHNNSPFPQYNIGVSLEENPFPMWLRVDFSAKDPQQAYPIITINFYVDGKLVKSDKKQTDAQNQFSELDYLIKQ